MPSLFRQLLCLLFRQVLRRLLASGEQAVCDLTASARPFCQVLLLACQECDLTAY